MRAILLWQPCNYQQCILAGSHNECCKKTHALNLAIVLPRIEEKPDNLRITFEEALKKVASDDQARRNQVKKRNLH